MNQQTMSVLRCPKCKGLLIEQVDGLLCSTDALVYPIRDGMPIMLIEQAIAASGVTHAE